MKTIEIKLYQFNELSEKAQERALEDLRDINVDSDYWYDYIIDEAKELCLSIEEFDIYRMYCKVTFVYDADETMKAIKENAIGELLHIADEHQEQIDALYNSYKNYDKYTDWLNERDYTLDDLELEDWVMEESGYQDDKESADKEFMYELSEYYLSTLRSSYDYDTSDGAIIDTIEANEYDFTENGKIY